MGNSRELPKPLSGSGIEGFNKHYQRLTSGGQIELNHQVILRGCRLACHRLDEGALRACLLSLLRKLKIIGCTNPPYEGGENVCRE